MNRQALLCLETLTSPTVLERRWTMSVCFMPTVLVPLMSMILCPTLTPLRSAIEARTNEQIYVNTYHNTNVVEQSVKNSDVNGKFCANHIHYPKLKLLHTARRADQGAAYHSIVDAKPQLVLEIWPHDGHVHDSWAGANLHLHHIQVPTFLKSSNNTTVISHSCTRDSILLRENFTPQTKLYLH